MKSKHICLFIISFLWALFAFSQEEEKEEIKEKTPRTFALRAGLDMIKLGRTQFEEGYQGLEIVGDLTFYSIISNIPKQYDNKWVKFFKNYGKTSGLYAVVGDSLYILVWTIIAYLIRNLKLDLT